MTLNDVIWMSVKIVKIIMWKLVYTASVEHFGHGKFLINSFVLLFLKKLHLFHQKYNLCY